MNIEISIIFEIIVGVYNYNYVDHQDTTRIVATYRAICLCYNACMHALLHL